MQQLEISFSLSLSKNRAKMLRLIFDLESIYYELTCFLFASQLSKNLNMLQIFG